MPVSAVSEGVPPAILCRWSPASLVAGPARGCSLAPWLGLQHIPIDGKDTRCCVGWRELIVGLQGLLTAPSLTLRGQEMLLSVAGSACGTASWDAQGRLLGMGGSGGLGLFCQSISSAPGM